MEYVADAHATAWHLFARQRPGNAALAAFDDAEAGRAKILIPAVAVAEVIVVVEKHRLQSDTMPQLEIELGLMRQSANHELIPLLSDLVVFSRTLTVIPGMFDRLIVAEALRLGLPLITGDSVIHASRLLNVIWN